jgi:ribulose-phosphate 3-epimerase
MALIAPSLLAADFAQLGEALHLIKEAGASMVHVDVMDGHFVPDITVGQPVIRSLRKATDLVLDIHLLVERPERYAAEFLDGGADRLAVQAEATLHLPRLLDFIRARGAKAGVAINPATPVEAVSEVLGDIDFLTILASEPLLEAHSQDYRPRTAVKLRQAFRAREEGAYNFALQVEGGGVGFENLDELVGAGADILVAASDIFQESDPRARLQEMMRLAAASGRIFRV